MDMLEDKRGSGERGRPALTPDDYKRRRRERRLERTLHAEAAVQAWARKQGFALRVLNDGHHWILEKPGLVAEWWPSSARLALNRNYLGAFHAPHWPDVKAVLERSAAG
jgi:hypothetical protein